MLQYFSPKGLDCYSVIDILRLYSFDSYIMMLFNSCLITSRHTLDSLLFVWNEFLWGLNEGFECYINSNYGLLRQRFFMINKVIKKINKCFVQQYSTMHMIETNKLCKCSIVFCSLKLKQKNVSLVFLTINMLLHYHTTIGTSEGQKKRRSNVYRKNRTLNFSFFLGPDT